MKFIREILKVVRLKKGGSERDLNSKSRIIERADKFDIEGQKKR